MAAKGVLRFLLSLVVTGGAVSLLSPVWATPPQGLESEPVAKGELTEAIPVNLSPVRAEAVDVREVVVVQFKLAPGGSFGWHRHGGPVWAVIRAGALTFYDGTDPQCRPQVLPAGSALLDPGDRVHIARNEGEEPVEIYATFMLPEGGEVRLDAADPGHCPF